MKNISSLSERARVLGAATMSRRKRLTIDVRMPELQNLSRETPLSPMTGLSYRSVPSAIAVSTRLANMLSGIWASLFSGRSRSTRSPATSTLRTKSSKRHFGLGHLSGKR